MTIGFQERIWALLSPPGLLKMALVMILFFFITYLVSMAVLVLLPDDYFLRISPFSDTDPGISTGKKILGAGLLLLGIFLSLPGIPGPGFVFVALGLALMGVIRPKTFVGYLLRHPALMDRIDRLRARFGRPPLRRPP